MRLEALVCLLVALFKLGNTTEPWLDAAMDVNNGISQSFDAMKKTIHSLGRQLMLQQFQSEQRVRTEGNSGIKQVRNKRDGSQNYHSATHIGKSVAAIHDHANNIHTVGMGELEVVMNGVEFRTRHNDYRLYMPHPTSSKFRHTVDIPFPAIPDAVKGKNSLQEQIEEMQQWFKAFRDQNDTVRDYKKHFKPILCYMEGAWTITGDNVDEPFHSDRHFIDAKTWFDLQRKNAFTAASGSKSRLENLAFLPTTIIGFKNETIPEFAQWNYRILCHPLKRDLPLNRLRVTEDLSARMQNDRSIFQHLQSRAARFQINPKDDDLWNDGASAHGLLDELMEEIPGADNYQGHITGTDLDGNKMLNMNGSEKDMSRYHRWYRIDRKDAMGLKNVHRSFSDSFMFAAMTNQKKIPSVSTESCRRQVCRSATQRWTYAIPLEIIYLTPLNSWNPYDLQYKGKNKRSPEFKSVRAGGRNGKCEGGDAKAYNGTNRKVYYITPLEFFTGSEVGIDSADTSRSHVCVLDRKGVLRKVRPAGIRTFLPYIQGVGVLRQRYPIMPIHGEGSAVWKELNAIRSYVMNADSHGKYAWDVAMDTSDDHEFEMSPSRIGTAHTHRVVLTSAEYKQVRGDVNMTKLTSLDNGHQHEIKLHWNQKKNYLMYIHCGSTRMCRDRHPYKMISLATDKKMGV